MGFLEEEIEVTKKILISLINEFSISGFYDFIDLYRSYNFSIEALIKLEEFNLLLKRMDFVCLFLSVVSEFSKMDCQISKSESSDNINFLKSYLVDMERKNNSIKYKVDSGMVTYELFESARPFSAVFRSLASDPGKDISKDTLYYIEDKQLWRVEGKIGISHKEAIIISKVVAKLHSISEDAAYKVIAPSGAPICVDRLNFLLEECPGIIDALISKRYSFGWNYSDKYIVSVLCSNILGLVDAPDLRAAMLSEIPSCEFDIPIITVSPDVWLSFVASSEAHFKKWKGTRVEYFLRRRVSQVISYLLETPVNVTVPDLISTISGALLPYQFDGSEVVEAFHPVGLLLSRFYDEASPYDAWDRTDPDRNVVDAKWRESEFFHLIDCCIIWHLWGMADNILAFYLLSDYVAREKILSDRLEVVKRYESMMAHGYGFVTARTIKIICRERASAGAYRVYFDRINVWENRQYNDCHIDIFSAQAARNLSSISGLGSLSEKAYSLIEKAELRWCESAHRAGADKMDWGDVVINYFRGIEAELQWRFGLISSKIVSMNASMLNFSNNPTGVQISKLIQKANGGEIESEVASLIRSVIPFDKDRRLWKDLIRIWPLRNKAAHGGGGVKGGDVVDLRNQLYEGGILARFCNIFG